MVTALEGDAAGRLRRAHLSDGTTLERDVAVVALGAHPQHRVAGRLRARRGPAGRRLRRRLPRLRHQRHRHRRRLRRRGRGPLPAPAVRLPVPGPRALGQRGRPGRGRRAQHDQRRAPTAGRTCPCRPSGPPSSASTSSRSACRARRRGRRSPRGRSPSAGSSPSTATRAASSARSPSTRRKWLEFYQRAHRAGRAVPAAVRHRRPARRRTAAGRRRLPGPLGAHPRPDRHPHRLLAGRPADVFTPVPTPRRRRAVRPRPDHARRGARHDPGTLSARRSSTTPTAPTRTRSTPSCARRRWSTTGGRPYVVSTYREIARLLHDPRISSDAAQPDPAPATAGAARPRRSRAAARLPAARPARPRPAAPHGDAPLRPAAHPRPDRRHARRTRADRHRADRRLRGPGPDRPRRRLRLPVPGHGDLPAARGAARGRAALPRLGGHARRQPRPRPGRGPASGGAARQQARTRAGHVPGRAGRGAPHARPATTCSPRWPPTTARTAG